MRLYKECRAFFNIDKAFFCFQLLLTQRLSPKYVVCLSRGYLKPRSVTPFNARVIGIKRYKVTKLVFFSSVYNCLPEDGFCCFIHNNAFHTSCFCLSQQLHIGQHMIRSCTGSTKGARFQNEYSSNPALSSHSDAHRNHPPHLPLFPFLQDGWPASAISVSV